MVAHPKVFFFTNTKLALNISCKILIIRLFLYVCANILITVKCPNKSFHTSHFFNHNNPNRLIITLLNNNCYSIPAEKLTTEKRSLLKFVIQVGTKIRYRRLVIPLRTTCLLYKEQFPSAYVPTLLQ